MNSSDQYAIQEILQRGYLVYQHPDWLNAEDLLLEGVVFLLLEDERPSAVIGFTNPLDQFTWLHFFAVIPGKTSLMQIWEIFFKDVNVRRFLSGLSVFCIPSNSMVMPLVKARHGTREGAIVYLSAGIKDRRAPEKAENAPKLDLVAPPSPQEIFSCLETAFPSFWRLTMRNIANALVESDDVWFFSLGDDLAGYLLTNRNESSVNISRLAVAPELQNKGIGSQMISFLFDAYGHQPHKVFTVNTYSANLPAISLYRKFGFKHSSPEMAIYSFYLRPKTD